MAHVIEAVKGMNPNERCDRCGAQAYMQVRGEKWDAKSDLMFCAHHAREHEDALKALPNVKIADHRPALMAAEGGQRDAASAPK